LFLFLRIRRHPISTLFPYTTLFRSHSAFYKLNLAAMHADVGWPEAALEFTQQALALLDRGADDPSDPLCLPFPFDWNEYRVQYRDRKSTRLNSSHDQISYAVFCLKK